MLPSEAPGQQPCGEEGAGAADCEFCNVIFTTVLQRSCTVGCHGRLPAFAGWQPLGLAASSAGWQPLAILLSNHFFKDLIYGPGGVLQTLQEATTLALTTALLATTPAGVAFAEEVAPEATAAADAAAAAAEGGIPVPEIALVLSPIIL